MPWSSAGPASSAPPCPSCQSERSAQTVTLCHSRTVDLAGRREADILAAVGRPEMVKADMVKAPSSSMWASPAWKTPAPSGDTASKAMWTMPTSPPIAAGSPRPGRCRADDHREPAAQHPHCRPGQAPGLSQSEVTPRDREWMARRGRIGTAPNPRVGCVLVRDGHVPGWHAAVGGPAEAAALQRSHPGEMLGVQQPTSRLALQPPRPHPHPARGPHCLRH